MSRLAAAALAIASIQLPLRPSLAQSPPTFRTVYVDAIATDDAGNVVPNLTAADFEVVENGAPLPIESVRFVAPTPNQTPLSGAPQPIRSKADERLAASDDGVRLLAIYLDEYHVTDGPAVQRTREAIGRIIDRELGPKDLVTVVRPLDSLPNIRLTRDRDFIRGALARFSGRRGNYESLSAFERAFMASDRARIDSARAQIAMSAMNAIANHLGTLTTGRKTLVVVSEGFTKEIRQRGEEALPSFETVARSANRAGVSIYPLDPRTLDTSSDRLPAASSDAERVAPLRMLAAQTDGRVVEGDDDPQRGIDRIVSDASGYYLITFEAPRGQSPGRFHPVEVRSTRTGIALRTRNGYWLPPADTWSSYSAAVAAARLVPVLPALTLRPSRVFRPWFGVTRDADGQPRVQFIWEPAPGVPGSRSANAQPDRVTLRVWLSDGTTLLQQDVAQTSIAASRGDTTVRSVSFEMPPGRFRAQMSALDAERNLLDHDVRDVLVRPMDKAVVFGTPQVFRAGNAREYRDLEANLSAVPVAARDFSRTDRLMIRVPLYAAGPKVEAAARLVSDLGAVMRELPLSERPGGVRQIDLPLAGLAANGYRIELVASDGSEVVQETVAFRVVP